MLFRSLPASPMSQQSKLSKKQKKGLAFRQRQKGKAAGDIPEPDLLDEHEDSAIPPEDDEAAWSHDRKSKGKGKSIGSEETKDPATAKKRKTKDNSEVQRGDDDDARPAKKAKLSPDDAGEDDADTSRRNQVKARYILFVGRSCLQIDFIHFFK